MLFARKQSFLLFMSLMRQDMQMKTWREGLAGLICMLYVYIAYIM